MAKLKELKKGMKEFGETISTLTNTILLTLVYIIGVGITSIIARIVNKKFMKLETITKETYWENIEEKKDNDYYRQF